MRIMIRSLFISLAIGLLVGAWVSGIWPFQTDAEAAPVDYEICIRQYEWVIEDVGFEYWTAPNRENAEGWIDLRKSSQKGPGPIPDGWVLVIYNGQGFCKGLDVLASLGVDINGQLTGEQVLALETGLDIEPGRVTARNVVDVIWDLQTQWADRNEVTGMRGLNPNVSGQLIMALPGFGEVRVGRIEDYPNLTESLTPISFTAQSTDDSREDFALQVWLMRQNWEHDN